MPRNSSGIYTVPSGTTAVIGQQISPTAYNAFLTDLSTAVSGSLNTAGSAAMVANLNMGGFVINNVATPLLSTDAANMAYVQTYAATNIPPAGRNKIINGGMSVNQRYYQMSITGTSGGQMTVDRWSFQSSISSKGTITQSNSGPALGSVPAGSFLMYTASGAYSLATGDYFAFTQQIEAPDMYPTLWGTSSAQSVTLSFWAFTDVGGTYSGSIGNLLANQWVYAFNFTLVAGSWQQITIVIPGDTASTWVFSPYAMSSAVSTPVTLSISMGMGATGGITSASSWGTVGNTSSYGVSGSANIHTANGKRFAITNVQLEVAPAATPFNALSYADVLAFCMRQYETSFDNPATVGSTYTLASANGQVLFHIGAGLGSSQPTMGIFAPYKVTKSAVPSVTVYSPNSGTSGKAYDVAGTTDVTGTAVNVGTNGFTCQATPSAARTVVNLAWHWSASTGI